MKYVWITGLFDAKLKVEDIGKVQNPAIDLDSMESEEVSGIDFQLPINIFPILYADDDIIEEVTKSVTIPTDWNTTGTLSEDFYVSDNTDFVVGEYYWIKTELIKVTAKGADADGDYITANRKQLGTFPNAYYRDEQNRNYYYITKYPKTFVGLRVVLYEDNDIIGVYVIKESPEAEGNNFKFSCDDLMTTLDVNFPLLNEENVSVHRNIYPVAAIMGVLYRPYYYKTEVPPVADYFRFDVHAGKLFQWGNELAGFVDNKFENLKDFFTFYGKVNLMPISFDQYNGVYRFISFSSLISLETITSVELSKYLKINERPSSSAYSGISEVKMSIPYSPPYIYYSALAKGFNKEKRVEFDFTDFVNISNYEVRQVALRYLNQFSFIYSVLNVPSGYFKFKDFQVGRFYDITDIDKFYTYQNISSQAMCIGKDEGNLRFAVIREVTKYPIVPGVPVTVSGAVATFGWSSEEFFIEDFLFTSPEDTLEDATLYEYGFKYYLANDKVVLEHSTTGTKYSKTISSISGDDITVNSAPAGGDGEYWLYWDNYSTVLTRQQDFFYYNVNNW